MIESKDIEKINKKIINLNTQKEKIISDIEKFNKQLIQYRNNKENIDFLFNEFQIEEKEQYEKIHNLKFEKKKNPILGIFLYDSKLKKLQEELKKAWFHSIFINEKSIKIYSQLDLCERELKVLNYNLRKIINRIQKLQEKL
tara:strand:- start:205 stop:630 length:426 start_codon:yes stop_codon:yes gene_type:complete